MADHISHEDVVPHFAGQPPLLRVMRVKRWSTLHPGGAEEAGLAGEGETELQRKLRAVLPEGRATFDLLVALHHVQLAEVASEEREVGLRDVQPCHDLVRELAPRREARPQGLRCDRRLCVCSLACACCGFVIWSW